MHFQHALLFCLGAAISGARSRGTDPEEHKPLLPQRLALEPIFTTNVTTFAMPTPRPTFTPTTSIQLETATASGDATHHSQPPTSSHKPTSYTPTDLLAAVTPVPTTRSTFVQSSERQATPTVPQKLTDALTSNPLPTRPPQPTLVSDVLTTRPPQSTATGSPPPPTGKTSTAVSEQPTVTKASTINYFLSEEPLPSAPPTVKPEASRPTLESVNVSAHLSNPGSVPTAVPTLSSSGPVPAWTGWPSGHGTPPEFVSPIHTSATKPFDWSEVPGLPVQTGTPLPTSLPLVQYTSTEGDKPSYSEPPASQRTFLPQDTWHLTPTSTDDYKPSRTGSPAQSGSAVDALPLPQSTPRQGGTHTESTAPAASTMPPSQPYNFVAQNHSTSEEPAIGAAATPVPSSTRPFFTESGSGTDSSTSSLPSAPSKTFSDDGSTGNPIVPSYSQQTDSASLPWPSSDKEPTATDSASYLHSYWPSSSGDVPDKTVSDSDKPGPTHQPTTESLPLPSSLSLDSQPASPQPTAPGNPKSVSTYSESAASQPTAPGTAVSVSTYVESTAPLSTGEPKPGFTYTQSASPQFTGNPKSVSTAESSGDKSPLPPPPTSTGTVSYSAAHSPPPVESRPSQASSADYSNDNLKPTQSGRPSSSQSQQESTYSMPPASVTSARPEDHSVTLVSALSDKPAATPSPYPLQTTTSGSATPVSSGLSSSGNTTLSPPTTMQAIQTASAIPNYQSPTKPVSVSHATPTGAPAHDAGSPGAILPPTGVTTPQQGQMFVQIGFNCSLNYDFVASSPIAATQIFQYLPRALEYAMPDLVGRFITNSLRPFPKKYYRATVALFIIETGDFDELFNFWNDTDSALYHQNDTSVQTLVSLIDRSIPLDPFDVKGDGHSGKGNSTESNDPTITNKGSAGGRSNGGSNGSLGGSLADTQTVLSSLTNGSKIALITSCSAAAVIIWLCITYFVVRRARLRAIQEAKFPTWRPILQADRGIMPPTPASFGTRNPLYRWSGSRLMRLDGLVGERGSYGTIGLEGGDPSTEAQRSPILGHSGVYHISGPMRAENSLGIAR